MPFADFSSDEEEDPNADIKGKMLTMYNWKSQRKEVKQEDVDRAEAKHQSVKDWENSNLLIGKAKKLMAMAKKTIDSGQEAATNYEYVRNSYVLCHLFKSSVEMYI